MSPRFLSHLVICCIVLLPGADARQTVNIFWNSTNPIFRVDNTDDVIDVQLRDTINLICPTYNDTVLEENTEQSIIYRVSEYGYKNCELHESKAVGQCRNPYGRSVVTLLVLEFTPSPTGLEYSPGNSYYFITTSTGKRDGLTSRRNGLCNEENMRFKLNVQPTEEYHASTLEEAATAAVPDVALTHWRNKLHRKLTTENPSPPNAAPAGLQPANMEKFLQKLRHLQPTTPPDSETAPSSGFFNWWQPKTVSSKDQWNFRETNKVSGVEIHEMDRGEELSKTRYWPAMDDANANSLMDSQEEPLILYEIQEGENARYTAFSLAPSTVRLSALALLFVALPPIWTMLTTTSGNYEASFFR